MVYPPEDKHIYHFYGSFNAKLGHIRGIRGSKRTVTDCDNIAKGPVLIPLYSC